MLGGQPRVWVIMGVLSLLFVLAGQAGARGTERAQDTTEDATAGGPAGAPKLQAKISDQDSVLRDSIQEISTVGSRLDEAQSRVDAASARVEDLRRQTRQLRRQVAEQDASFRESQARYREQARAAYKSGGLEGLGVLLGGWFGSWEGVDGTSDPDVIRILLASRQNLAEYREAKQELRNTQRQISQKRRDYNDAIDEQRAMTVELRRHEQALGESIDRLRTNNARTEARLHKLKAGEKARLRRTTAATGVEEAGSGYEREVAGKDIVVRNVDPSSHKEYMDLYRKAANEYGFGPDWYVLAAVGYVETNHGQYVATSSAGAMGPMAFLPSTWEAFGVDGNGDGVANIMDPEDAIPAAASYLARSGAPQDWYRALFAYNHADWYVKKVLAVAEGYRRLAKDESVGPYM
jgi:peptidoglycan hydrolase CwlO-like protein